MLLLLSIPERSPLVRSRLALGKAGVKAEWFWAIEVEVREIGHYSAVEIEKGYMSVRMELRR
jgi:hypothetical protein